METIEMTPSQVMALLQQGAINDCTAEIKRIDNQIASLMRRRNEVKAEILRRAVPVLRRHIGV